MKTLLPASLAIVTGMSLLCSCAAKEDSRYDNPHEKDGSTDTDTDIDIDIDIDADTDTDTEGDAGADSGPPAGNDCLDPIVLSHSSGNEHFTSDWMYFQQDTFDGQLPGCYDETGRTIWFSLELEPQESLVVTSGGDPYLVNFLEDCEAAECITWGRATDLSPVFFQNNTHADQSVTLAVESEIPYTSASIDLTFDWRFRPGETCNDPILLDQAAVGTPQQEILQATDFIPNTTPSSCGHPLATGQDIWFQVPIPPMTEAFFQVVGPDPAASIGYGTDCLSCELSQSVAADDSFSYRNTTLAPVNIYPFIVNQSLQAGGDEEVTLSFQQIPPGDICTQAIDITAAQLDSGYTWTSSSGDYTQTCPTCSFATGQDVWHQLTVPAGEALQVQHSGTTTPIFFALLENCSTTPTVLATATPPTHQSLSWYNDSSGPASVLLVTGSMTGAQDIMGLQINAQSGPPVSGNHCAAPIIGPDLSTGAHTETGTWSSFSNTWNQTTNLGCASTEGPEIWFEFTVPPQEVLTVQNDLPATSASTILNAVETCSQTATCPGAGGQSLMVYNDHPTNDATVLATAGLENPGTSSQPFSFTFTAATPNAGDSCSSALSAPLPYSGSHTLVGKGAAVPQTASCPAGAGADVFLVTSVPPGEAVFVEETSATECFVSILSSCPATQCDILSSNTQAAAWYNDSFSPAQIYAAVSAKAPADNTQSVQVQIQSATPQIGDFCQDPITVPDLSSGDHTWSGDTSDYTTGFSEGHSCLDDTSTAVWFQVPVPGGHFLHVEETAPSAGAWVSYHDNCAQSGCTYMGNTPSHWYNSDPVNTSTVLVAVEPKVPGPFSLVFSVASSPANMFPSTGPSENSGWYYGYTDTDTSPCPSAIMSGTNLGLTDSDSEVIYFPSPFLFYGEEYNAARVHADGFITLSASLPTITGGPSIPYSNVLGAEPQIIASFWDDLHPGFSGWVYADHDATVSVVQWLAPPWSSTGSGNYSFTVAIDRQEHRIHFCYDTVTVGDSSDLGAEASIGLQKDNDKTLPFSNQSASLADGMHIVFEAP